jgi:hypothetical protein
MSNQLSLLNVQVPAHIAARIGVQSELSLSLAGGLSTSVPRISIKGSRFRIVEGGTEQIIDSLTLATVIVGANRAISKEFYKVKWTPESPPTAPDCWSLDGESPAAEVAEPVNNLCATCPKNAWGSEMNQQNEPIKACKDSKRLAVVSADDVGGQVYLLEVTPAALKGLNAYQKTLAQRGIPPEVVITNVSFDPDAHFPKLQFNFGGFLTADQQQVVDGLFGSDEVLEITGSKKVIPINAIPQQAVPQPVAQPVQQVAQKPAAPPVQQVVPQPEPQPEPAKKRGFGAKAAAQPVAQPVQQVVAQPVQQPVAQPTAQVVPASDDMTSLFNQIANMIGDQNADDA